MAGLPPQTELVVAAKGRNPGEVLEAVEAGAGIIGENYVQEAEAMRREANGGAKWHLIGHLQRNKVTMAVRVFDMIQTVDSVSIAREIDRRCGEISKTMPVLIEVNSGREPQKAGVLPEDVEALVREIAPLHNLKVMGLMTMGPVPPPLLAPHLDRGGKEMRPYFALTRSIYDSLARLPLPNVEMKYLSMGMSHSYLVAIEEGANMIRLGREIFGEREHGLAGSSDAANK